MFPHKWPKSAFVAGNPVLDFLNTVDAQGRSADHNRLTSYTSALAWSVAAGLMEKTESQRVDEAASCSPEDAAQALSDLVEWRESVHRVLTAIANNEEPPPIDWKIAELSIQKAISTALLSRDTAGLTTWRVRDTSDLTTLRQKLALGLHALLGTDLVINLKLCEGCSWMFIDPSKNHRRRWCSMATCGNRAKAKRNYQSKTAAHDAVGDCTLKELRE